MRHLGLILLLLALGVAVFGIGIGRRDMWAPDEPRFAQVTREMLDRRDFFVLHLNDGVYTDKPPMLMWLAAWLNGPDTSNISSFAMRAPSVAGGLIALVAVYALTLSMFGSTRIAFASGAILATTTLFAAQANCAQLDMLMCGWGSLAMLGLWHALQSPPGRRRLFCWVWVWIFGALGTLSKGPPSLMVALGTAVFYWMWQTDARKTLRTAIAWTVLPLVCTAAFSAILGEDPQGGLLDAPLQLIPLAFLLGLLVWTLWQWLVPAWKASPSRFLGRLGGLVLGLLVFAAIVGVWFIPYKLNVPAVASEDTLWDQTVVRYFVGLSHKEPFWFFLLDFPENALPWTLFALLAAHRAWKGSRPMAREPFRFLAVWFLFTFLFFSISPGKRDMYLLPCVPAVAILCAWFFDQLAASAPDEQKGFLRLAWLNAAGLVVLIGAALVFQLGVVETWMSETAVAKLLGVFHLTGMSLKGLSLWGVVGAGLVLLAATLWAIRRRHVWGIVAANVVLAGGVNLYAHGWLMPARNAIESGRSLSDAICQLRDTPSDPVATFAFFRPDFLVYGDFKIQRIERNEAAGDAELKAFLAHPQRCFVILMTKDYEEYLIKRYPDLPVRKVTEMLITGRSMTLLDNRPGNSLPSPF
jgi:4-amino-4-deoxy-L-arabinose transferase-like glycosyltransferase